MGLLFLLLLLISVAVRYGASDRIHYVLRQSLRWGFLLGGIGFAGGFFGPMIFAPQANQGPLLGIFITGPCGFLLGVLYGLFRVWRSGAAA